MTTAPVKSLIDEQLDDVESKLIMLGFGLPFNEVIGQPRERAVATLPKRLAATMKGGRIAVRVRPRPPTSSPGAYSSGAAPSLPSPSAPF